MFTLSLDVDSGEYTFTQFEQLDHSGDSLDLDFTSLVQFQDYDGDTVDLSDGTGTFTIAVEDDAPEVNAAAGVAGTVDEDALPGGAATVATGDLSGLVDYGEDGSDGAYAGGFNFVLPANFTPLAGEQLTTRDGETIHYIVNAAGTLLAAYIGPEVSDYANLGVDNELIFTLELSNTASSTDEATYTFTLLGGIDHVFGDQTLELDFATALRFTDGDGDTVSLNSGQLVISVEDAAPIRLYTYVPDGSGGQVLTFVSSWNSIQKAVDASSQGDVIEIDSGIYDENVVVNNDENLTFTSVPAGSDVLINAIGVDTDNDSVVDVGGAIDLSDVLTLDGHFILKGTVAADTLIGSQDSDHILGYEGDDTLYGNDGEDTLSGGEGNDTIDGGDDDDTLYGGDGADTLAGGEGYDYMDGGAGDDTMYGGIGDDQMFGDSDNDSMDGGAGDDLVHGEGGDDSLSGGEGDDLVLGGYGGDSLAGNDGSDSMYGNDGNDTLVAGKGDDILDGGIDTDTAVFSGDVSEYLIRNTGSAEFTVTDSVSDRDGVDVLRNFEDLEKAEFNGVTYNLVTDAANTTGDADIIIDSTGSDIDGGTGGDVIYAGTTSRAIDGGDDADLVILEGSLDEYTVTYSAVGTINGGTWTFTRGGVVTTLTNVEQVSFTDEVGKLYDLVGGTPGVDATLNQTGGGSLNNIIFADNSFDTIYGESGDDYIQGGNGSDTVYGGDGDDTFLGGDNSGDTLYGEGGDDTFQVHSGDGSDKMYGGDGDDTFEIVADNDSGDLFDGGAGSDSIVNATGADLVLGIDRNFNDGDADSTNDSVTSVETLDMDGHALTIQGGSAAQTIDLRGVVILNNGGGTIPITIDGGTNTDTIYGTEYSDLLYGGGGSDTVYGGDGDDTIFGNDNKADLLYGEGGHDTFEVYSGDGDDKMYGGADDDTFRIVTGNDAGDLFDGGVGSDTILNATGADLILNVAGNVNDGDADTTNDSITDVETIDMNGHALTIQGDSAAQTIDLRGVTFLNNGGGTIPITIDGGTNTDTIYGSQYGDLLYGGGGSDTIYGGDGDDTFLGNDNSADLLYGEGGDDTFQVYSGDGADRMYGGEGDDIFSIVTGADSGELFDGGGGTGDTLVNDTGADLVLQVSGNIDSGSGDSITGIEIFDLNNLGLTIQGGNGSQILDLGNITWVNKSSSLVILGGASHDTIIGTADGDYIDGENGNDVIYAGGGDDILIGTAALAQTDQLYGEEGDDTFQYSGTNNGWDVIDGGIGTDTIVNTGATAAILYVADNLNAASGTNSIQNVEILDMNNQDMTFMGDGSNQILDVSTFTIVNPGTITIDGDGGADTITGSDNADIIYGGSGFDTITGGKGDDTLVGEEGRDTFEYTYTDATDNDGADYIDGGETGTDGDTLNVHGSTLLVKSLENIETINGDSGGTVIQGVAQDAATHTGAFIDLSEVGSMSNITEVIGSDENDQIIASQFDDTVTGGAGDDTMDGGLGTDTAVYSGSASDYNVTYDSATGAYTVADIRAGAPDGADTLTNFENITLDGVTYTLTNGSGTAGQNDFIVGTSGDDSFAYAPGDGNDYIDGAGGDDTVTINIPAGSGVTQMTIEPVAGTDEILVTLLYAGGATETLTLRNIEEIVVNSANGDSQTINITGDFTGTTLATSTVEINGDVNDEVLAGGLTSGHRIVTDGVDSVQGGAGDDLINGTDSNDTLAGNDGNDAIYGNAGNDTLDGGVGDDTLEGGDGEDQIYGGEGNDEISGGGAYDYIQGGAGNDVIDGGDGNDIIYGHTGDDVLSGGAGDDTIDGGADSDIAQYANAEVGNFEFDYDSATDTYTVTDRTGAEGTDTLTGVEQVSFDGKVYDLVHGASGDDTITGTNANEIIVGLDGDDELAGGAGDDVLLGGDGSDTVMFTGNYGEYTIEYIEELDVIKVTDNVAGRDGVDYLRNVEYLKFADTYVDVLEGTAADESFNGGSTPDVTGTNKSYIDVIIGKDGDDTINGGYEYGGGVNGVGDHLYGNGGNDTFVLNYTTNGPDTIDGGSGVDTIKAGTSSSGMGIATATLAEAVKNVEILDTTNGSLSFTGDSSNQTLDFSAWERGTLDGSEDESTRKIIGGNELRISGGQGSDTIHGSQGDDVIMGGYESTNQSADLLHGEGGNDTFMINYGVGADTIDGGTGVDTIKMGTNSGSITIATSTVAEAIQNVEIIDLSSGNLTIQGDGSNQTLDLSAWARGTLDGTEGDGTRKIIGDGTLTIDGGAGSDTIIGSQGDDTIYGGYESSGYSEDAMYGGDGDDTFLLKWGNGADSMDGGAGSDTISLVSGTNVSLTVTGDFSDSVTNVENLELNGRNFVVNGSDSDQNLDLSGLTVTDSTGGGDVVINAGAGEDTISGTNWDDTINGGADTDTAAYADAEVGNFDFDYAPGTGVYTVTDRTGAEGTDTLIDVERVGFDGKVYDLVGGSNGDDTISGTDANEIIVGLDGDDELTGGKGDDVLLGGDGSDTAYFSGNYADYIIEYIESLDVLKVTDTRVDGDGVDYLRNVEYLKFADTYVDVLEGTAADESFNGGSTPDVTGTNKSYIDVIIGKDGDDTINGGYEYGGGVSGVGDHLYGNGGNDTFILNYTTNGLDTIDGGSGVDSIKAGTSSSGMGIATATLAEAVKNVEILDTSYGSLSLTGDSSDQTLDFSAWERGTLDGSEDESTRKIIGGNELIINGGEGSDTIRGSQGGDVILGGYEGGSPDADALYGEGGNDTFRINYSVGADTIDGGDGVDSIKSGTTNAYISIATATVAESIQNVEILDTTGGNLAFNGNGSDQNLDFSAWSRGTLDGTEGDATRKIIGSGTLTIDGGAGSDTIHGSQGDDIIEGGYEGGSPANDDLYGEGGDDTFRLRYSVGADSMDGGAGDDTISLTGGGYVNMSVTGDFSDSVTDVENLELNGRNFNVNGSGADQNLDLSGLTVTDSTGGGDVVINAGAGEDTISGTNWDDTINGGEGTDTVDYSGSTSSVAVDLDAGTASGTATGSDTLSGIENVIGTDYGDILKGDANANVLTGGGGDDFLQGEAGNDALDGGDGIDTAIYSGDRANFQITKNADGSFTVHDTTGTEGTDTVVNVENLDFGTGDDVKLDGAVQLISGGYVVNTFDTIQEAIDAASDGDTVFIKDGVYVEQITVQGFTNLTIVGESEDGVIIQAPDTLDVSVTISGSSKAAVILVSESENVSISNLTVDGDDATTSGNEVEGVLMVDTSATVSGITVTGVGYGSQIGVGIYGYNLDGTARTITVEDCTVNDFSKNGMTFKGDGLTANVLDNEITGDGLTDGLAQNGIQFSSEATGSVTGNDISGIEWLYDGNGTAWVSCGILLYDQGVTVQGNTVTSLGGVVPSGYTVRSVGVYVYDAEGGAHVVGNDLSGLAFGIITYYDDDQPEFSGNTITDCETFIEMIYPDSHVNVTGSDGPDILVGSRLDTPVTDGTETYQGDTIDGGAGEDSIWGMAGDDELHGGDGDDYVDGGDGDPSTSGDGNDTLYGEGGDDYLFGDGGDDVLYGGTGNDELDGGEDTSGSDNDTAMFSGSYGDYNVSYNAGDDAFVVEDTIGTDGTDTVTNVETLQFADGSTVLLVGAGGYDTIQEAIDAASEGDTILIAAGTYEGGIEVTKGLTIVGLGEVTIEGGTDGYGFDISASNVTLENLNLNDFSNGVQVSSGSTADNLTLTDVDISGTGNNGASESVGGYGVYIDTGATVNGMTLTDMDISDVGTGVRFAGGSTVTYLVMSGGTISDSYIGVYVQASSSSATTFDNCTITGVNFTDLPSKGIYIEAANYLVIDGVIMNGVGDDDAYGGFGTGGWGAGIDINLKYGDYTGITIMKSTFVDCGNDSDGDGDGSSVSDTFVKNAAVTVKARGGGDDTSYSSNPATVSDVTIEDNSFDDCNVGIRVGEAGKTGTGATDTVTVSGNTFITVNTDVTNETDSLVVVTMADSQTDLSVSGHNIDVNGNDGDNVIATMDDIYGDASDGPFEFSGGDGDDTFSGGAGPDIFHGGDGRDTVDYSHADSAVTINLTTGTATISGSTESDTLDSIENVIGSDHSDTINGDGNANNLHAGAGHDYVFGLGGDDSMYGGDGNDTIHGGDGKDTIHGGDGSDLLDGGADHDTMYGDAGADTMYGNTGDDTLYGGDGDDNILGNEGSDNLDGGAGDDVLTGGAGDDTFSYDGDSAVGNDTIMDFLDDGSDSIDLDGIFDSLGIATAERGYNAVTDSGTGDTTVTLTGNGTEIAGFSITLVDCHSTDLDDTNVIVGDES